MDQSEQQRRIQAEGLIAIVRLEQSDELMRVARAIRAGGVGIIEFTMTTPGALGTIKQCSRELGDDVLLGAGTVLDPETARAAILAGAQFVVAPTLDPATIQMCHRYGKVVIPGVFTPTEALAAWQLGADFVKLFPASVVGPGYVKALRAPLPQLKIIPVGGISAENTSAFIAAGAVAMGVGSSLVNSRLVAAGDFDRLTERARALVAAVRRGRRDE